MWNLPGPVLGKREMEEEVTLLWVTSSWIDLPQGANQAPSHQSPCQSPQLACPYDFSIHSNLCFPCSLSHPPFPAPGNPGLPTSCLGKLTSGPYFSS